MKLYIWYYNTEYNILYVYLYIIQYTYIFVIICNVYNIFITKELYSIQNRPWHENERKVLSYISLI